MDPQAKVLIVDDEPLVCRNCSRILHDEGFEVEAVESGPEALERMDRGQFDLVIADLKMPGMSGLEVLKEVKKTDPSVEVVMITGYATISSAVEAVKSGAYDYISKPFSSEEIAGIASRAIEKRRAVLKAPEAAEEVRPEEIVPRDDTPEKAEEGKNVIAAFREAVQEGRIPYDPSRPLSLRQMQMRLASLLADEIARRMKEKGMTLTQVCRYRPTLTKICDLISRGRLLVLLDRWAQPFRYPGVGLCIDEKHFKGLYLPGGAEFRTAETNLKAFEREIYRGKLSMEKIWGLEEIRECFDAAGRLIPAPRQEPLAKKRVRIERGSYFEGELTGEESLIHVLKHVNAPAARNRVVVISDDPALRESIQSMSVESGYRAQFLEAGDDVARFLSPGDRTVVILDMGDGSEMGEQIARRVREIRKETPIIALSAAGTVEVSGRIRDLGVFFHTVKPLDMEELGLALRDAFASIR
jgi:DNA-binding response OmpR family regulator